MKITAPKLLWILTILILVGFFIIQYVFLQTPDFTNSMGQTTFVIDFLISLLIIVAVGVGLGYLVALIPFKTKPYKQRVKTSLPLMVSVVAIILCGVFGYSAYLKKVKGIELRPLGKYTNIRIPPNLECSSVHNGKFETDKLIIERSGDKQFQTDKVTGEKNEYKIEWVNDCEYTLTSILDNSDKLKVKIVAVSPDNYDCFIISVKYKDKDPNFATIKRIKEN